MMLEIAPDLDRAGYRAIDFTTSTHMAVTVRFHKENPWERIRLMKAAHAAHAAELPFHRHALHLLGDGASGADGLSYRCWCATASNGSW